MDENALPFVDEEEVLTQCTQDVMDPRRLGCNNSGLCAEDVSDVICILHPTTPAAFRLVTETARRAPQHVLQAGHHNRYNPDPTSSYLDEEGTFILHADAGKRGTDLAVRFSAKTIQPRLGFVFGRNRDHCDVVVSTDAHKRVSNVHFSIFINDQGTLMLQDMSTNGTMVDEILLKGRGDKSTQTRMLINGSIVQILSPNHEEILRWVIRVPSRDGHVDEYTARFTAYMRRRADADLNWRLTDGKDLLLAPKLADEHERAHSTTVRAPIIRSQYGMHWNGGEVYNVVGFVGKGAFASVYQLATKKDGRLFAAKELEKRKFMKNGVLDRKLGNEMQIMQQIHHPNVVSYVDYQDQANHLYIIMEFVGCGDLQQYLVSSGPLPEGMAKQMASQVFDALEYLHRKRITHRDIKPDNILIADMDVDTFTVKLSDFGLSKVVKDNETFLRTFCGTLLYCAPEVFPHYESHLSGKGAKRPRRAAHGKKGHIYSSAVDIWSFGAVLWYSLCLKPPFEGVADNTGRGMFDQIMWTPLDAGDLVRQGISSPAIDLLVTMLNTDPAARPPPRFCYFSKWLGRQMPPSLDAEQAGLGAIAEEGDIDIDIDEEGSGALDVASLSLHEAPGSTRSELSISSADFDFFDPRQSKRVRTNEPKVQPQDKLLDSSAEALYHSIPIMHDDRIGSAAIPATPTPVKAKLFGEISRSNLQSPAHGKPATTRNGKSAADSDRRAKSGTSPSLFGAESLVRGMHMHAGYPATTEPLDERKSEFNEDVGDLASSNDSSVLHEITPKRKPVFNRQIQIEYPPSYYWKADDPSTHTLEYASKASGHDYSTHHPEVDSAQISMAATRNALSSKSDGSSPMPKLGVEALSKKNSSDLTAQRKAAGAVSTEPRDPPSARYGRLISTHDSFERITLDLNRRVTSWGRASCEETAERSSYKYPNSEDTRIPKTGIVLCFHANGIEGVVASGGDWTEMPGLHCTLLTHSSLGLKVNGVRIPKQTEKFKQPFGRLHHGDVIEVFPNIGEARGLFFKVEIYCGEGANRRPHDAPPFDVEISEKVEIPGKPGEAGREYWAPSKAAGKKSA